MSIPQEFTFGLTRQDSTYVSSSCHHIPHHNSPTALPFHDCGAVQRRLYTHIMLRTYSSGAACSGSIQSTAGAGQELNSKQVEFELIRSESHQKGSKHH